MSKSDSETQPHGAPPELFRPVWVRCLFIGIFVGVFTMVIGVQSGVVPESTKFGVFLLVLIISSGFAFLQELAGRPYQ